MIDIHIAKGKNEIDKVLKIRERVFIKEQRVASEIERDDLDDCSEHIILYYDNDPVGCMRIRQEDNRMKFERLAVLKHARSKGLGKAIMSFAINYARKKKMNEVYMYAQYYLLDFYKKLGFAKRGDIFEEAGMKHIEMYFEIKNW